MIALNLEMLSSFCLHHLFIESALRMQSICFASMTVQFMYCENVSFGSKVISRIFECSVVGSI